MKKGYKVNLFYADQKTATKDNYFWSCTPDFMATYKQSMILYSRLIKNNISLNIAGEVRWTILKNVSHTYPQEC